MLIKVADLKRIRAGEVSLVYRRWKRSPPTVGKRLRTAVGELEVLDVREVRSPGRIPAADYRAAGFESKASLLDSLHPEGRLWRIELRYAGEDQRAKLRSRRVTASDDREAVLRALETSDARSDRSWTRPTLTWIGQHPGVPARELAAHLGEELATVKRRVRRLKELGLTESLEVGYRLSPRGRDFAKG